MTISRWVERVKWAEVGLEIMAISICLAKGLVAEDCFVC